jgi:riboflavin kinase, archaea type
MNKVLSHPLVASTPARGGVIRKGDPMGEPMEKARIKIRGKIVEGLGVGRDFTCIQWVKAQFISKLGINPYPGALNLEIVDPGDLEAFQALKATCGIEITPGDRGFCSGKCYPILINRRLRGAIVLPVVEDYPRNKMELITSENAKQALSVEAGDILEVEIL